MTYGPMLGADFEEPRTALHLQQDGWMLIQPKIDGMRVLHADGVAKSRSWKEWTNTAIQAFAGSNPDDLHGWDGELLPGIIEGTPTSEAFRTAQSGLRAADGSKELTYYLFDNWDPSWSCIPYWQRLVGLVKDVCGVEVSETTSYSELLRLTQAGSLTKLIEGEGFKVLVKICPTFLVTTLEQIYDLEGRFLAEGYEGAMLKRKGRGYKWGRATALEGSSTKLKRFTDFESEITGVYAREHNANEATVSALGKTVRSSHQENKVELECLGGFYCRRLDTGVEHKVGVFNGLSMEDKERLWQERSTLPGKVITCKEQQFGGGYDKPRTPVFHGFRDPIEL